MYNVFSSNDINLLNPVHWNQRMCHNLGSMDTDMCIGIRRIRIHHFLKQSDTWIRLNIFSKNNTVHTRYKIKENKQQYSMRTHFKGFKHDP
jgi:hypothetical protein